MIAPSSKDILIVGGYGVVGKRIAAHLAPQFEGRVVIAGRDEHHAASTCGEIGHGAKPRRIDVNDAVSIGLALEDVGTVVACVAQREPHLLRISIGRGVAFTDIAPRLAFWRGAEELSSEARKSGARILLGAGLSPGISNMMAKRLSVSLGGVERIETAILLSLGDEYGPDALNHVLEAVTQTYSVLEDGRPREASPFSEGRSVTFPEPHGPRTAYLFPWSDVVYYPMTLGAQTALGRFAIEPAWVGRLASLLVRAGGSSWLRRPGLLKGNRRAIDRLKHFYAGRDQFALVVTAEAGGRTESLSLTGRHQADVTAAAAAVLARMLASEELSEAGVWLPEQVVSPERFFARLGELGFHVGS